MQDSRDNCASIERPERKGFVLQGLFQAQRCAALLSLYTEALSTPARGPPPTTCAGTLGTDALTCVQAKVWPAV